jgi:miniconductance mechanosensitive channel
MIELVRDWLVKYGLTGGTAVALSAIVAAVIVLVLAYLANIITKKILLKAIHVVARKSEARWDDIFVRNRVFHRLSHLAPAIVIFLFAPVFPWVQAWIQKVCLSYMIIIGLMVLNALLNSAGDIYNSFEVSRHRPIKGYVQLVKIFLYVVTGIFVISTLIEKSPWGLISGLGALTAILLLVFKDSILGLVASVQLSTNNMVQIGDWIEMPRYGADGDVIDVSLHTVKVRNWDKTITTIPTYTLISDSFKNWRGMQESGGRRIKRAINIDMSSVKFCSPEMLDRFEKIHFLGDYIRQKRKEIAEYNQQHDFDTSMLVNGRNLTNIGTFRAYIAAYLRQHPMISQDMTFLIRHLNPTPTGLPIEIYVFSKDIVWANYEAIQADIFDHILAVIAEFELRVFQNPSGGDLKILSGIVDAGS